MEALGDQRLGVAGVLLRAELPRQRPLAALAARELLAAGLRTRIVTKPAGRVASRRALAGIDPGGDVSRRAGRLARGLLAAQAGQALPLVLGGLLALVLCTLILAAFGGAVTGTSRVQRAADLAALSAARSMRDDFERLFEPARSPDGSPNPAHLAKAATSTGRRRRRSTPRGATASIRGACGWSSPIRRRLPRCACAPR